MSLLFVNTNVIHHVLEREAFVGESTKVLMDRFTNFTHLFKISSHFFDQVQIVFFFTHCIHSKPAVNSRTYGHLDWIKK